MSPKITTKKDYILIEPQEGTEFREIQRGLARLFYADIIPQQNRIWIFRKGGKNLTTDDLYKLKDIIKENYPKNAGIHKTAIVVETGLQKSLADTFIKITAELPQEFKVFSNLRDAEDWVRNRKQEGADS